MILNHAVSYQWPKNNIFYNFAIYWNFRKCIYFAYIVLDRHFAHSVASQRHAGSKK